MNLKMHVWLWITALYSIVHAQNPESVTVDGHRDCDTENCLSVRVECSGVTCVMNCNNPSSCGNDLIVKCNTANTCFVKCQGRDACVGSVTFLDDGKLDTPLGTSIVEPFVLYCGIDSCKCIGQACGSVTRRDLSEKTTSAPFTTTSTTTITTRQLTTTTFITTSSAPSQNPTSAPSPKPTLTAPNPSQSPSSSTPTNIPSTTPTTSAPSTTSPSSQLTRTTGSVSATTTTTSQSAIRSESNSTGLDQSLLYGALGGSALGLITCCIVFYFFMSKRTRKHWDEKNEDDRESSRMFAQPIVPTPGLRRNRSTSKSKSMTKSEQGLSRLLAFERANALPRISEGNATRNSEEFQVELANRHLVEDVVMDGIVEEMDADARGSPMMTAQAGGELSRQESTSIILGPQFSIPSTAESMHDTGGDALFGEGDANDVGYEQIEMSDWSVENVRDFVLSVGRSPVWKTCAKKLADAGIDGAVLRNLKSDDLVELGVPKFHVSTLLNTILQHETTAYEGMSL